MSVLVQIIWQDEPGGNVEHLAEHGVEPHEAEAVIRKYFADREPSWSDPVNWVVQGATPAGRWLMVVFAYLEDLDIAIPITAYEPEAEE